MIKTNYLFTILLFSFFCQSCSTNPNNNNSTKDDHPNTRTGRKYTLTIYQDKYNSSAKKFEQNNRVDTVIAANDTVGYLMALKKFYSQKIIERQQFNYGQPKSFTILDANGVDLTVNLSDKVVTGLKSQVENTPDVKNMIEEYKKDSL